MTDHQKVACHVHERVSTMFCTETATQKTCFSPALVVVLRRWWADQRTPCMHHRCPTARTGSGRVSIAEVQATLDQVDNWAGCNVQYVP